MFRPRRLHVTLRKEGCGAWCIMVEARGRLQPLELNLLEELFRGERGQSLVLEHCSRWGGRQIFWQRSVYVNPVKCDAYASTMVNLTEKLTRHGITWEVADQAKRRKAFYRKWRPVEVL